MLYRTYRPRPPLQEFVDFLWMIEDAPAHHRERILPGGTMELVINLREDSLRVRYADSPAETKIGAGIVVSGGFHRYFEFDSTQHESMMGVHFRPGGAWPFLGMPADEIANRHLELPILWGRAAALLRERILEAQGPSERFRILEGALFKRLSAFDGRHYAVSTALPVLARSVAESTVRELSRSLGLSERRFIQVFSSEVGLTPKKLHRLVRFQRSLERIRPASRPDWGEFALDGGYFDQSHLIRDFREFSGLTPGELLRRRSDDVIATHLPVSGE